MFLIKTSSAFQKNKLIKLMSNDKKIFYTKKLIIAAGSYSKNILEKSKFKKKIQKFFLELV